MSRAGAAAVRRVGAVAALGALIAVGPTGSVAGAASNPRFDQITGSGSTPSAVTASWKSGLLDDTNHPVTGSPAGELAPNSDRSGGTGPLSFMYQDFSTLKVTVSQTQDITNQGVTVAWTGGTTTSLNGTTQANFLQLMECYGDSASGPDPEQCEFGSQGLLPRGTVNGTGIGTRDGFLCAPGAIASPPVGVPSADGSGALNGCDPEEPGNASPSHIPPCTGTGCSSPPVDFSIPFVPVGDPSSPAYGQLATSQYFNEFNTNEVQEAVTSPKGTGQLQFEALTGTQAPGLGCGELESNGQPRNCWLVIVPRGTYEPNGFKVAAGSAAPSGFLNSSPLSASNWAMRIQIHLSYAPLTPFCPIGTQETETAGTQIITRAMGSWELALNKQANCKLIYGFSAGTETESTQDLCDPASSTIGLAFTTIPIGSEAARDGSPRSCKPLPKVLYAPVAVSAVGLGFNINDGRGAVTTPVKMSPALLAKSLTQVYRYDLPDYYPPIPADNGPAWSVSNPLTMSNDPEFQKLNPPAAGILSCCPAAESLAPLVTEDNSALNQQIWQWIQADPATVAWLDKGTLGGLNTVAADPDYEKLQLGKPQLGTAGATDNYPRGYGGVLDLPPVSATSPPGDNNTTGQDQQRHSLDLLPYVSSYDDAASKVLTADNPATGEWDPTALSPTDSTGWWGTTGVQPLGQIFIWGISDTPDLASYGLIDAQLCDDSGGNCVAPTTASVGAALAAAKPDGAGLLEVNPAKPGKDGYPLVQVTYAAVATNQTAAALNAYADLIAYAAGPGQTAGVAPGNLPPGYLPLPATLKAEARAVVARLRADAAAQSPGAHPSTSPGTSGGTTSGTGGSLGGGQTAGGGTTPSPPEYNTRAPGAELAATSTPPQPVGAIRWALLAVVIAGAACATSGTVLRTVRVPSWLRRMRS